MDRNGCVGMDVCLLHGGHDGIWEVFSRAIPLRSVKDGLKIFQVLERDVLWNGRIKSREGRVVHIDS